MSALELYEAHLRAVVQMAARALAESALEPSTLDAARVDPARAGRAGLVLHAGSQVFYPADDRAIPFRTWPHFARFAPVPGPDHLLCVRPDAPVRLAMVVPRDYWEEPPERPAHPFADVLEVREVGDLAEAVAALGDVSDCALIGSRPDIAEALGIPETAVMPRALVAALDWYRAFKTPYEVACIREAGRIAARGHAAAHGAMLAGRSERAIHAAYLDASGALDGETPYPNIVAWDEKSAILHYQGRRTSLPEPGRSLLIDAGATYAGYASDVTRTYARADAHPVFREALDLMEALQRSLVARVSPGTAFLDLHDQALRGITAILREVGVLRCGVDEATARGIGLPFFPHGLGHHLGLQVHDVGGRQVSPAGETRDPPPAHPYLRTTRDLAPGHVVTIEPGLYFIPMLLAPLRGGPHAECVDWALVDALTPCGGIRIEDDVLVTETGHEDLTRPHVPGHTANAGGEPAS